ncbi:NADP-dependent alcohol dehydrogenase C 2 [Phytophthora citrophthora]|uniref:NADP-dependent alcohol dehydrogenase C 2 n=1 Tax=Phytophthora citrophthora TaxID=4793 RepID=A0AAD9GWV5_9STRA|nr:NADP-dependent alcohol dehydrogenase C 2 [Phytophthora citrophthora]
MGSPPATYALSSSNFRPMSARTIQAYATFDSSGECKPWQYEPRPLGTEDVEIKITHCGICGSDVHTLDSGWGPAKYPVVTGHAIVGTVTTTGSDVKHLAVGDRVGVGTMVWACRNKDPSSPCDERADGFDPYCKNVVMTCNSLYKDGPKSYGGYADFVLFKIPENIPSDEAAPLLCAGVMVFAPLRREGVKPGDRVGVIGIGGLGHLAIQFIRAMGGIPVAFSHSTDKEQEVRALGAQYFYNLSDPKDAKRAKKVVLAADANNMPYDTYLSLLRPRGTFIMVGLPNDKLVCTPGSFVRDGKRLVDSKIGIPQDVREMLDIASKGNVRPIIQKLPMEKVNDGLEMVRSGRVRYRVVLENPDVERVPSNL